MLGGLALGFIPGLPRPVVNPEIVLVGILPPLLYSSAFFTSLRDLRRNARPLALFTVGLVLATRIYAADAALARLEELASEDWVRDQTLARMRGALQFRRNRFAARFAGDDDGSIEQQSQDYQRLEREILATQREAVVDLRRQGPINDDVMNRIQRDFDLEDARLDI